MAKIGEMIESKYLKQSDLAEDTLVTIEKVGKANVAPKGEEAEYKWLIRFSELPKPMVLNSTNIKRLARACGSDDTDDWTGKRVMVYVDPDVEFGGNVVGGLRIRAVKSGNGSAQKTDPNTEAMLASKKTGGRFDDMADDVPF